MELRPVGSTPADEELRWAFIVGAPRCGTTSLSKYLKGHPDVGFARIKEPHFFAQNDLTGLPTEQLREVVHAQYLERYFREREGASVLAEGSVTYLYFPEQMEPILRLWPRAKFIIALRSPLQMIPSLHQRLIHNGDETEREFRRAWALVPERREGRSLPSRCADPRLLDYWEIGKLGRHVEKFMAVVGRERCFISIFDDLARDPGGEYRELLEFLELPDNRRSDFSPNRKSKSVKSIWLQRLLMRPPKRAIAVLGSHNYQERFDIQKPPKPIARAVLGLRKRLLNWNEAPARKPDIGGKLLGEMRDMYRDDIALLSQVTGRDLSHWIDN
ncbi:MAG: sulfotransferase family protein [Sphingomicrobium sp.]